MTDSKIAYSKTFNDNFKNQVVATSYRKILQVTSEIKVRVAVNMVLTV